MLVLRPHGATLEDILHFPGLSYKRPGAQAEHRPANRKHVSEEAVCLPFVRAPQGNNKDRKEQVVGKKAMKI